MDRQRLGRLGEDAVAQWYEERGGRVIARNWRNRYGELDLVVLVADTLVFCEVKTRRSTSHGHPFAAVTHDKQQRIRVMALHYLQACGGHGGPLRFDVAAVLGNQIDVLTSAF